MKTENAGIETGKLKNPADIFKYYRFNIKCIAAAISIFMLPMPNNAEDNGPARLKFSGVLGQSQATAGEALPFLSTAGAVATGDGKLWTISSQEIFCLASDGSDGWTVSEKIKLPSPIYAPTGMMYDGKTMFFLCWNWKVYKYAPGGEKPDVFCDADWIAKLSNEEKRGFSMTVAPLGTAAGYAAKGKLFFLVNGEIRSYDEKGADKGAVLKLPAPDGKWWYTSVGVEPESGDLLVGAYYPRDAVFRFDASGGEVKNSHWPRNNTLVSRILELDKQSWALGGTGGRAVSLPAAPVKNTDSKKIDSYWTVSASGLAKDSRGYYWLACSQGLVEFDDKGAPTKKRLGGIPAVEFLNITEDGTVYSMVEGQRLIRLNLDDEPDTAFTSDANEVFRIGYGWKGKAADMAWDGEGVFVLDKGTKQLWKFIPEPIRLTWPYKPPPWIALTKEDFFSEPKALAIADERVWVLYKGKLLEGKTGGELSFKPVDIPNFNMAEAIKISGIDGKTLILSTKVNLAAYALTEKGYERLWVSGGMFSDISGITSDADHVVVADGGKKTVSLLSAKSGKLIASLAGAEITGGMQPGAISLHRKWIVVSDKINHRLIRLQIAN